MYFILQFENLRNMIFLEEEVPMLKEK